MAILIIEHQGKRQAGALKGRVLIGRWADNTVVIDDRAVSRIHAWVGLQDGRYYIADAGSRTGTFVNGEPLRERHVLRDGDQIRIGPAVLRYRIDSAPPAETQPIDLSPRPPAELSGEQGVFMDCVCGAPLWLPRQFAGVGQCRYCGHTVTQAPTAAPSARPAPKPASPPPPTRAGKSIKNTGKSAPGAQPPGVVKPLPPAPRAFVPPAPATGSRSPRRNAATGPVIPPAAAGIAPLPPASVVKPEKEKDCGVCHAGITIFDEVTTCPSCGLFFHTDCWQENRGCSAFGCEQVGALEEKEEPG